MITMSVKVNGAEVVSKKLAGMARDLDGPAMEQGMRDATMIVTRDAKDLAPVDTGRLRASITPQVESHGRTVRGIVGSNVAYAPMMEFGTGVFAGNRPHWPPSGALEVWARRHGFASGFVVARAIGLRGGLRPRKFLETAFVQNADKIVRLVGEVVGRIVSR